MTETIEVLEQKQVHELWKIYPQFLSLRATVYSKIKDKIKIVKVDLCRLNLFYF